MITRRYQITPQVVQPLLIPSTNAVTDGAAKSYLEERITETSRSEDVDPEREGVSEFLAC
jgi:hypothetical protein